MAYDDTTRSATTAEVTPLALLADTDAVLPDIDHCTVRTTSDVSHALARTDPAELVVLGPSSSPAAVTDAIRRLRGGRTRTLLVCQGALPAPVDGTVTTIDGRDDPERAVERAVYLALVDRHHSLTARRPPVDSSAADEGRVAAVASMRATYAERLDQDDFGALYSRL